MYWLILSVSAGVILEPLTWILDGNNLPGGYYMEYYFNVLLFLAGPILIGLCLSYVDYYIFHNIIRLRRRLYYQHGALFSILMLIINHFTPIYFYVDSDNTYQSANLMFLHYALVFFMYGYLIYLLYSNSGKISRKADDISSYFSCYL